MKRTGAPWSGIVYAVLAVVGMFLLILAEPENKTDQQVLSHYADSGNRAGQIVGFFVLCAGVFFFLWFVSTLRSRLRSAEPEPRTLSTLGFGAGVAAAALLIGAGVFHAGIAFAMEDTSRFVPDPNTARLAAYHGYLFVVGAALINCVLVATTSVLALRSETLPNWVGWVGLAAIALTVAEVALLPIFAIPIWAVIVSIVLMARPEVGSDHLEHMHPTAPVGEPVPTV